MEDVGDERVKVTLDPCNMLHPGTIFRTTKLLDQCFDLLGDDIPCCHAKDKVWNEILPHFEGVTLGDGWLDYETYLARMSRMAKPGVLLIEHLPKEQICTLPAASEGYGQQVGSNDLLLGDTHRRRKVTLSSERYTNLAEQDLRVTAGAGGRVSSMGMIAADLHG